MTIGYKATHNYKCRNQVYEIGQEYKIDEKPILCQRGFHYCLDAKKVLIHYDYNHNFKLLEIEDLSNETIHVMDKSCSNHIRIVREVTDSDEILNLLEQCYTYNEQGKVLEFKDLNGYWHKSTYDEFGNRLMRNYSDGDWEKRTYNEKGQLLTSSDSNGSWFKYTYDNNDFELSYENSDGFSSKKTWSDDGKLLSHENSNGYFRKYIYDQSGNCVRTYTTTKSPLIYIDREAN